MSHSLPLPASARSAYLKNVSITSYLSTGFPCSKRRPWYIMRAQEQVGCYYSEAFDCPYKITNTFPAPMEYIWLIYTTKTPAFRCSLSLVLKLSKFQNRIIHLRSVTKNSVKTTHCYHAVKIEINIRICKETGRLPNSGFLHCFNYSYITYKGREFAKAIHANIIYIISNKLINPIFILYIKLTETL